MDSLETYEMSKMRNTSLRQMALVLAVWTASLPTVGCGGGGGVATGNTEITAEQQNDDVGRHTEGLIAAIEPHLRVKSDGRVELNPDSSRAAHLDDEAIAFAETTLQGLNDHVAAGNVRVSNDLSVVSAAQFQNSTQTQGRANERGLRWYWWGARIALTSGDVEAFRVTSMIYGVPGVVKNMAKIGLTGSWVAAVAGPIVSAWISTINYVDRVGGRRGVYIHITWSTFTWVTHQ